MIASRHPFMLGPVGRLFGLTAQGLKITTTPDLGVKVLRTLSGGARTQRLRRAPRVHSLQWVALSDAQREVVSRLARGVYGGPLVFANPEHTNLLRQAVSTGSELTTWVPSTGVLSAHLGPAEGLGAATWTTTPGATLTIGPPVPVLPSYRWTGTATASGTGRVRASATWLDATGAVVGTSPGDTVTLSAQPWRLAVSYLPPAGAVTGRLVLTAETTGAVIVEAPQVQWGPRTAFTPDTGLAYVSATGFDQTPLYLGMSSVNLTLQEVI